MVCCTISFFLKFAGKLITMQEIKDFYPSSDSLEQAEEPYRTIATMINEFYRPNDFEEEPILTMKVQDYLVVSCIRQIAEDLAEHKVTFIGRMQVLWKKIYNNRDLRYNDFKSFSVPNDLLRGLIFGGVYYVLYTERKIRKNLLEALNEYIHLKVQKNDLFFYEKFLDAVFRSEVNEVVSEDLEKKTKGLSAPQAALFCEALLQYHKRELQNKKEIIGPLGSQLFGYAESTMERNTTEYGKEDKKAVANIFKNIDPEFSDFINGFGKKVI